MRVVLENNTREVGGHSRKGTDFKAVSGNTAIETGV